VIALVVAVVVVLGGGGGVAWSLASGHTPSASASASTQLTHNNGTPAPPLRVLSVTPSTGSADVNGGDPIDVTFSAPLATGSAMPTLSPDISGSWAPAKKGSATMVFTPASGFTQDTKVTVTVPAGAKSAAGGALAAASTSTFKTGYYSTLRLQELFAQLGYLPFTWTATGTAPASTDANAQVVAAYDAPQGTFTWNSGYPQILKNMWAQGQANILDVGAVRAFESVQGLTMDGIAGHVVWRDLLKAAGNNSTDPNGYTYAVASKVLPESLTIWHDGHVVLRTPANTGIPAAPTADGTYPVYEKLPYQVMQGTNPDGTKYSDPVVNVSYFHGGDAVHYFDRASYGWQQSLGCVELPMAASATAYKYLSYGSLVTVTEGRP
jgi:peptidoglycan hydrolase-like protein with peptidoglycan-binding domain